MLLFYLQYNKGAGGSRQGKLPGGGGDGGDFGQGVVLTQNQRFAVQSIVPARRASAESW